MIQVTPDYEGYREAQERLRRVLGESIILLQPASRTYAAGVALDPESGEPFDPLIQPATSGQVALETHGRVAFRAIARNDSAPVVDGALGFMEDTDIVAILSSGAASAASGAVGMVVRDERYEVRAARPDGLAGVDRYLVYGAKVTA